MKLRISKKISFQVNVDTYPGPNVQTVSDSSRYFVVKPVEGPPIGVGFADRTDSFDLNMALNEHFKSLKLDEDIAKESETPREQLDLSLKAGQTIKVHDCCLIMSFNPILLTTIFCKFRSI